MILIGEPSAIQRVDKQKKGRAACRHLVYALRLRVLCVLLFKREPVTWRLLTSALVAASIFARPPLKAAFITALEVQSSGAACTAACRELLDVRNGLLQVLAMQQEIDTWAQAVVSRYTPSVLISSA
jgi:hypothetical protein